MTPESLLSRVGRKPLRAGDGRNCGSPEVPHRSPGDPVQQREAWRGTGPPCSCASGDMAIPRTRVGPGPPLDASWRCRPRCYGEFVRSLRIACRCRSPNRGVWGRRFDASQSQPTGHLGRTGAGEWPPGRMDFRYRALTFSTLSESEAARIGIKPYETGTYVAWDPPGGRTRFISLLPMICYSETRTSAQRHIPHPF